jgi:hypothetical protein
VREVLEGFGLAVDGLALSEAHNFTRSLMVCPVLGGDLAAIMGADGPPTAVAAILSPVG